MQRAAAFVVAALSFGGALPALGEGFASFEGTPPFASVAAGGTLALPRVVVRATTSPSEIVHLQVVGSCGTLGGATQVDVQALPAGALLLAGTPPAFIATTPGSCKVHLSWQNFIGDLNIDVYDPATLRLQPGEVNFPIVSVAKGDSSGSVEARVVDAGGFHAGGKQVRYDPDPSGCALLNGKSAPFVATTDAAGIAALPLSVPADAPAGACNITATLVDTGTHISIEAFVYDAALATLTPTPDPNTAVAGQTLNLAFAMHDGNGNPLPNVYIYGRDVTYDGGPGLTGSGGGYFSGPTNNEGTFRIGLSTNNVAGRYEISILAGPRGYRVPVVQSLSGQPPPPPPPAPTVSLQDMWWGGATRNGWGVSIIQHRDTLFGMIYAYSGSGASRWLAIPGGTWDETHTRYTGPFYEPRGAPLQSYDVSRFVPGKPLGTATFIFTDNDHFTLDLEFVDGGTPAGAGHQALSREIYGNKLGGIAGLGDMWWGGPSQNGWGVSVLQQQGSLFVIWYTYGTDGLPTWYVIPDGTWTATDTYEGAMYSTRNASDWIDQNTYNPATLQVTQVGSGRLRFAPDSTATFTYSVGSSQGTLPLVREPF